MSDERKVYLKNAHAADIIQLQKVCIEAYNTYFIDHWNGDGHARYLHKEFSISRLLKDIKDPNIGYYFIMHDKEIAGFTKLMYDTPAIDNRYVHCAEVVKIYLLESVVGKGLGTIAMSLIEKIFIDKKRQNIFLKVVDTNTAIRFYKRLGFVKHSRCILEEPDFKEAYKGMFLMVKQLNN